MMQINGPNGQNQQLARSRETAIKFPPNNRVVNIYLGIDGTFSRARLVVLLDDDPPPLLIVQFG